MLVKFATFFFLAIFSLYSPKSFSAESCDPLDLGVFDPPDHPEYLFLVGTCNFRIQNYEEAARLWSSLTSLDNVEPKFEHLYAAAHNNLGFLNFLGHGVQEDKQKAVDLWHIAAEMGDEESEYHLCHSYADANVSTWNREKAIIHCNKAEQLYSEMSNRDADNEEILRQIRIFKSRISN